MEGVKVKPNIELFNGDCLKLIQTMPDQSIDIICTDPPYLYLKGQKLERPFDERKFFEQCKRVLTKDGFIVLFGRGTSFYRWNVILDELEFQFKEEVIWNKRRVSSPVLPLGRVHETVSIHSIGKGKINKSVINYGEIKAYDLDKITTDIKRIFSALQNETKLLKVLENIEKANRGESYAHGINKQRHKATFQSQVEDRCVATYLGIAMLNGQNEQSIINDNSVHYNTIHPTQKPVRLIERLLTLVVPQKPKKQIVVADFFGGSMSIMEAVHNMGMQGIACEIDEEYFNIGLNRIASLNSPQPELF